MSLWKDGLYALLRACPPLRRAVRDGVTAWKRRRYERQTKWIATEEKTVVFCTFAGRNCSDSPRAVYEYMLSRPEYQDYHFIWAFLHPERFSEVAAMPRTEVVAYGGAAYHRAMAKAEYWVFNYRVADDIWPRPCQVYVQCWHGTPLKRLGYDIRAEGSANAMNSVREIRQKYDLDAAKLTWLLSPSPFATEVFRSAWNLKAWRKEDAVLELGYPRNDALVNYTGAQVAAIRDKLGLTEAAEQGKKVLLYAPTFRDDRHSGGGYCCAPRMDFARLAQALGEEYILLFRTHYLAADALDFTQYGGFVRNVSDYPEVSELYLVSDALITDYSSVCFDYAILRRPEIFYMYDLAGYRDAVRGFYLSVDELPGPVVRTEEELIAAVRRAWTDTRYAQRYERFNQRFNPMEDGGAAKRLAEAVFR